ncbi:translocation/assembly module TamB domain-containing protein [Belnapia rosea]|uniref:Autotransporter secretion inner membrane protein TamB n=1 Tax=Belnapia rosea TaxID=938405 RepID=A0A1G6WSD6_9PROT|nr:translocation/assembly module TamB domain-containing protein [Belnapia rosea]SDD68830.1 autotransporter secretion inner membrane protein TamB [Belnapia rosea]
MRWLKWLLGALALLILLPVIAVIGALAWVNTESGGDFLARQAASFVPGLRIEGLRGPLPGHLAFARLGYADDQGEWVSLEDGRIDLDLMALFSGTLRIERIEAAKLALARLPAGGEASPAEPQPPADTVLPHLPQLPVAVVLDRLAIGRIDLAPPVLGQAAVLGLEGQARLGSAGLEASLDLRRLDAAMQAALNLALTPAADRLSARLTLDEAPGGLIAGFIPPPEGGWGDAPLNLSLTLDGPASGAALDLRASLGPEVALTGAGTVRATPEGRYGATLQGEARAGPLLPPDLRPLAVPLGFALEAELPPDQRLSLRQLDLTLPAGRLGASGTADLASEALDLRLDLALAESSRFGALLPAGLAWQGLRAEAHVTGTMAKPAIALTATPDALATGVAQADAVLGPAPRLVLQGALPGPAFDATLDGANGRLAAKGTLAEPIALDASLSLPRLEVLGAGSEGALEATVHATGKLADPDLTLAARSGRIAAAGRVLEGLALDARIATPASAPRGTAQLRATLDGLPVALDFRGRPDGQAVEIEAAEARLGPAQLTANGRLDPAAQIFTGTARLEAAELAPLGRLAGLAGLAGRLTLDAKLEPRDGIQGFDLRLDAPRLAYAGQDGSLAATVNGTPAALDWTLRGKATEGEVSGRGRLAAAEGSYRLDLAALQAQAMGETLRLANPARITYGADGGIEVAGLALAIGQGGRVQAAGRWGPERADLGITIAALPLTLAERFAPDLKPQGLLTGEVRATGAVAQPEIRARLNGTGIGLGADWARGLPALTLRAEASMAGNAAEARAEIAAGPAGTVTATARLPRGFGGEAPLAASLDGALNLAPLASPFLAAGADRVAGRLALALRAEGSIAAPRLGGRATLSGGSYRNPSTGIRLSDIAGTIIGEGTRLVIERLEGKTTGGGIIGIRGSVDAGAEGFPADLVITARNARPYASDLGTATIGADLTVKGPVMGGGAIAGEVRIDQADLRVPEKLPASVPTLTNVRQRGRAPAGVVQTAPPPAKAGPPAPAAPPLSLAVKVTARRVFIRGRGIDVEMGGALDIGGTVAAPVPSGALQLRRGTLNILTRTLTFQRGNIGFASGTFVPQLDMAAQATTGGSTTITVTVTGPANAPQIAFTSTPELPQDEVLARLLFDRATSNLSPFEIAQIAAAAAQLSGIGGAGGGPLDRVRNALGLDRLGVSGAAQGSTGATVEAGRYVAPGVFLGVRQGTNGGQTGVGVQVEITPNIKLEGQTATGPAGDRIGLSYEFEY